MQNENERSDKSEEVKANNSGNNDTSNQKNREEYIANEIKISNAYLKSANEQEEKITDKLLKISMLLSIVIITISIIMIYSSPTLVKVNLKDDSNKENENTILAFSFLYMTRQNGNDTVIQKYNLSDIQKICNFPNINKMLHDFDLLCEEVYNFRNSAEIVI